MQLESGRDLTEKTNSDTLWFLFIVQRLSAERVSDGVQMSQTRLIVDFSSCSESQRDHRCAYAVEQLS